MATLDTSGKIIQGSSGPTTAQQAGSGAPVTSSTSVQQGITPASQANIAKLGVTGSLGVNQLSTPQPMTDTGLQQVGGGPILTPAPVPTSKVDTTSISAFMSGAPSYGLPTAPAGPTATPSSVPTSKSPVVNTNSVSQTKNLVKTNADSLKTNIDNASTPATNASLPAGYIMGANGTMVKDPNYVPPATPSTGITDKNFLNGQIRPEVLANAQALAGQTPSTGGVGTIPNNPDPSMQGVLDAQAASKAANAQQWTPEQQMLIDQRMQMAKDQYQPMINSAQVAKTQGMGKAFVNAGQQGGFMNSQMAGVSALAKNQSFDGSGGQLEEIHSAFDLNIQNAQAQQASAMESARQSAITAIQTGKESDFNNAQTAYQDAVQKQAQVQKLAIDKQDALNKWKVDATAISQAQRTDAGAQLDVAATTGVAPSEQQLTTMDQQNNYAPGTSQRLYTLMQASKARSLTAGIQQTALDQAKDLVSVLKDMPAGKPVTINGKTYTGFSTANTFHGTETDASGNVNLWTYDPETQKTITQNLGAISKPDSQVIQSNDGTGRISLVNPGTGESRTLFDPTQPNNGIVTGGVISAFPQGTVLTAKNANGTQLGECGAFVNNLTGIGVGSDIGSKLAKMDPSISMQNAQVGDVVTTAYGSTGHVAIINKIDTNPTTGLPQYELTESNARAPLTVSHDRVIPATSVLGFARPGFMNPNMNFGSDVSQNMNEPQTQFSPYVMGLAKEVAATGAIPAKVPAAMIGQVYEAARQFPKPLGMIYDINTGLKPGTSALNSIDQNKIEANYNLKTNVLDRLEKDWNALTSGGSFQTGITGGVIGAVHPTEAITTYQNDRLLAAQELARATTGGVPNTEEIKKFEGMIPDYTTGKIGFIGKDPLDAINSIRTDVNSQLGSLLANNNVRIYGYGKDQTAIDEALNSFYKP
jgi:hypothetical protein